MTVAEEIRKRKAAAALLAWDDDDEEDSVTDSAEESEETEKPEGSSAPDLEEPQKSEEEKRPEPATTSRGPKDPLGSDYTLTPVEPPKIPPAPKPVRTPQPGPVPSPLPDPNTFTTETREALPPAQPSVSPAIPKPGQFETVTQETLPSVGLSQTDMLAQAGLRPVSQAELDVAGQEGRGMLVTPETPPLTVDQVAGRGELITPETPEPEVRRAQLVRMPVREEMVEPYTTPSFARNISPKAELVDPDPDAQYFDLDGNPITLQPPEVRRAFPEGEAPRAQPPGQVTVPAPAKEPETRAAYPPGVAAPAINPDGSHLPPRIQAVGNNDPAAFIVHHTSGRGTVDGVVSTLRERGLGVQYVMDREGNIYETGGPGAQNIKTGWGPKGTGLNNSNVVGMEIIALNDADVTEAQKQSFAQFIAARYPNTPLYGHGEVNPGHKEADEGQSAKAAALALRESGGAQPEGEAVRAEPATKLSSGFYEGEDQKGFITGKVTNFGFKDPNDPGVGAPRLGKINTNDPNVFGIAVPEEALRYNLGDNPAAWRKARVIVVDPKTGKRLTLPIVDLGPSNPSANADFTEGANRFFGNSDNRSYQMKIVANAGPDVEKDERSFMDEQAALAQGYDSSSRGKARVSGAGSDYTLTPVDESKLPDMEKARTANFQAQKDILSKLDADSSSPIGLFKRLNSTVEGVADATRLDFQKALKAEITKDAQQYYNEPDPEKAFARASGDANFGDFLSELARKIPGYYGRLDVALNQASQASDSNQLDRFAKLIHPEATAEQRTAFIKSITTDISDPAVRSQTIGKLWANLDPQIQAGVDINGLVQSADNVANPQYQKSQADAIASKKAWIENQLRSDPRMKGTLADWIADQGAQLLPNVTMALLPPGIRESAFAAQIFSDAKNEFRHDHPDWSEEQVNDAASKSAFLQLAPQEVVGMALHGQLGALVSRLPAGAGRAGARALVNLAGGEAGIAAQQIAANVAAGRPAYEGLEGALKGGAFQLAPGAILSLPHGPPARETQPEVHPQVVPERPITPEERPQIAEERPQVPEERPIIPEEPKPIPEEPLPVTDEDKLNKETEDLYKRLAAERELRPIEEVPKKADITEGEPEPRREGELGPVAGEVRPAERPAEVRPGMGEGVGGERRPEEGGGGDVPLELRRVPRPLETALSPVERAAIQPLVENLVRDNFSGPAYQRLFETVYRPFDGLFKAGGISRVDNPGDFKGAAAARTLTDGGRQLVFGHVKLRDNLRTIIERGNDPAEYLRSVLNEELLHHTENLAYLKDWNRAKAQGKTTENFPAYKFRRNRELIDNWLAARERAKKRGNDALAEEMTNGLYGSIEAYKDLSPQEAVEHFQKTYQDAKDGSLRAQSSLSNIASEMARQMSQLGGPGDWTEHFWKQAAARAVEWYQNVIGALKGLYRKLQPGQELAKTHLAKLIRGMQRELAILERRASKKAGEAPVSPETAIREGKAIDLETVHRRRTLAEQLRGLKTWYGTTFKGGESALLDYKETGPLALAIRRLPSFAQAFGARARVNQLADAFNRVPARDRARVVKEFTDYVKAEQNKQPLPPISRDTQAILGASKHTLEQLGQIAKELNVHVRDSEGRVRPMRLIGRDYYPRMISRDVLDMFNERDGTRVADFNALVNREIARGTVKSRDEFIDKFTKAISPDHTSNAHFANLEKAREAQLPLDFYDFSPEALIRYANRSTDRLAQIAAYGQKLSAKGKDLFDHTIEQVNKSGSLSYPQKQAIITRIGQERRAAYRENERSNTDRVFSTLRSAASGAFLGNPITSMYNLISGAAQNLTFGGPGAFAKTFAHFASVKGMLNAIKEARERNILKSNLSEILSDYDLVTDQNWATRGVQGFTQKMLHWGGQNITEGVNRAFAMQQAKYILEKFARSYGQNTPWARSLGQMIERRGVHDLAGLAREKGSGPLTDEFLRQYVMDVHGNYGPSQSAAHLFDSPAGKVLTQFQKWGANTARIATREFLMPLARAAAERKPTDFAYHFARNIGYLAAAVGAGGVAQAARNFLTGKDPQDPAVQEIWKRFGQGEAGRATQMALQRAWGAVILSGFTGTIGNYSDLINQFTGANPSARVKDPLHPPAWGIIQPFIEFFQGWHGENNFTAAPSSKVWDNLGNNVLSAYRTGKQIGLNAANAAGLKWSVGEEYAARNDLALLRSRVRQFEDENPEYAEKRAKMPRIEPAGRSEFDPIKDRIQAGLLTGHAPEVQSAIADWLDRFAPGDQAAKIKAIKQSIQSSSPIKPGGAAGLDSELQFLSWAKKNLPEGEARRIFAAAQVYAQTALETGLFAGSKTMNRLARIDYDKFETPGGTTVRVVKVAPLVPAGPTLSQRIRERSVAQQLLAR